MIHITRQIRQEFCKYCLHLIIVDAKINLSLSRQFVKSLILPYTLLILASCSLTGCDRNDLPFISRNSLIFSGAVEQQDVRVGSKSGGRIRQVLVREGDRVEAGQTLVTFETAEIEALLAQASARVDQQKARLERLERGARIEEKAQAEANAAAAKAALDGVKNWPRGEERAQAEASLAAAEAEQRQSRASFERAKRLQETGDLSKQEYDTARFRLEQSTARVEIEKKRLEILRNGSRVEEVRQAEERYRQSLQMERMVMAGPRREEIADARAQLTEAQARLEQIRVQMNEGTVTAPARSIVEVLAVRPGDLLVPNQIVARLLEEDQVWVRIFVPEPQLGLIKIGQTVEIRIDTIDSRHFGGMIEQINSQGEFNPRNVQSRDERNHLVFGVKVRIDNREGVLKSGMAAEVRIISSP